MKNSTFSKAVPILIMAFLTTLFLSCDMDVNKASSSSDSESSEESAPTSADLGSVDIAFCDENVDSHHGCSCDFKDGSGATVFLSNMDQEKSACLMINGKSEVLVGMRTDERHDHFRHSHIPDWIVLDPDGKVTIFNVEVDDSKYEENKDMIEETMLAMVELPKEIKIRTNKGAKGEEVSAEMVNKYTKMWEEALKMATDEKAKGNHGEPLEIELSNETYTAFVKAQVEKHNEDGSDNYKGSIEIKNKEGKVIGTKDFTGICQCVD